ncbi:MAG: pilin [bacterium]|nr:pilin [bacterium]
MKVKYFIFTFLLLVSISQISKAAEINLTYAPPCLIRNIDFITCPDVNDSIANYILRLYNFSLGIIGTIAFGSIVVGGIFIAFSGVADKKKEGREMITASLWGITILFGSYLILNTINPEIPKLREPSLVPVTLGELEIEGVAIGEGGLASCGQLFKDGSGDEKVAPEEACPTGQWPFATTQSGNAANAKRPQNGDQPGWKCENPFTTPSNPPTGTSWEACSPVNGNLSIMKRNDFKAYIAFFADGSREFKEKIVPCVDCEQMINLPTKSNGSCRLNEDNGNMTNCVCVLNTSESSSCQINRGLNSSLRNFATTLQEVGISWTVTEAYPPTVMHQSSCHFDGTCADIAISGDNCQNVLQAKALAEQSGLRVTNEYTECDGVQTRYGTGGHLHVSL